MFKKSCLPAFTILFTLLTSINTFGQITLPRTPSPAASVSQTIGISTVEVRYSRPSVKGRPVWGGLVPYGWNVQGFGAGNSAPWRAGANENTVVSFSHPVKIEGQNVPAGDYGLFFVINNDNTGEVILSKDSRSWGSFFYDQAKDQLRAKIQVRDAPMTELLTYTFTSLNKTQAELDLSWEKKVFPVKIEYDVDGIVLDNAEQELKGPIGFNWQGFASAANYAVQNKVELERANGWIDRAIVQNRSFATLSTKATILRAQGNAAEADKVMTDAIAIATEVEVNAYGYQQLNDGKNDKAIEMFVLNTKRYPKSPNAWDSLGEGYFTTGDKKNALASFKKAMTLNPPANVKANSEKYLQQLGAN